MKSIAAVLKKRLGNQGFSITEVVIAMGLITISSVAIFSYIASQKEVISKGEDSNVCRNIVSSALEQYKARDNRLDITECYPWNVSSQGGSPGATSYTCTGQPNAIRSV